MNAIVENQFAAQLTYMPAAGMPNRLYALDSGWFPTIEEAQEAGLDNLNGHDFANRIHIVTGVRDSYDGSVYAEMVEEHDVIRY